MIQLTILCVGKLKEKYLKEACNEYEKRLGAYCSVTITELAELAGSPSELEREAPELLAAIPKGGETVCLTPEGEELSSEELAAYIARRSGSGISRFCFVIGGSNGIPESVKSASAKKLSMSRMTFPHHLARVICLEQLYRAFSINNNGKYHK